MPKNTTNELSAPFLSKANIYLIFMTPKVMKLS